MAAVCPEPTIWAHVRHPPNRGLCKPWLKPNHPHCRPSLASRLRLLFTFLPAQQRFPCSSQDPPGQPVRRISSADLGLAAGRVPCALPPAPIFHGRFLLPASHARLHASPRIQTVTLFKTVLMITAAVFGYPGLLFLGGELALSRGTQVPLIQLHGGAREGDPPPVMQEDPVSWGAEGRRMTRKSGEGGK